MSQGLAERRLAAILAADVVGYSKLMSQDEEGTLAALIKLRRECIDPKILSYGGRIFKTTGDGLLAEFPSVVQATRCAVEVQTEISRRHQDAPNIIRITLRIGINLGDVIVENDDIFGDGVNIAARLEQIASPGGIAISHRVYEDVQGKVSIAFGDRGEQELKNIARPIRVWHSQSSSIAEAAPRSITNDRLALPNKPSIVVLPLSNNSGEKDQEYFADGLTQSLTTDLSRFRRLFVIGRNTAFTYKGKAVDLRDIGRALGVRYALEGSVQRGKDRVRVDIQLIDTHTGGNIWGDRFDRPLLDLFEVQDEIARRVAYSLSIQISKAERERGERERSTNPDSVDLVLRAMAMTGTRPTELRQRIEYLKRAVEIDPRNSDAWAGLARALANLVFAGWSQAPKADLQLADNSVQKALTIDPNDPEAIFSRGQVLLAQRKFAPALDAYRHAAELNPSHPNFHQLVGVALLALGRAREAFEPLNEAMRLSPRDFFIADFYMCIGWAHWELGDHQQAVDWLEQSIVQNSEIEATHFLLASTFVRLEQIEKAKQIIGDLLNAKPFWTVELAKSYPVGDRSQAGLLEDLRTAGLPATQ